MSKEFDVCKHCCEWFTETEGKSPATVRDTYPKMMRKVLTHVFGMSKESAKDFVKNTCQGNWERLHETSVEKTLKAEDYADNLRWDIFYFSDRWSWDRVLRAQWSYQRICDRLRWGIRDV